MLMEPQHVITQVSQIAAACDAARVRMVSAVGAPAITVRVQMQTQTWLR